MSSAISKEEWHKTFKEELFPNFAPQILIEKYSDQVDVILKALGTIEEDYVDSLLTDESQFRDYDFEESELLSISNILKIEINHSDKIVDVAKKLKTLEDDS